jgi:transcriptional regulator with XRE-family HTH domain
MTTVLTHARESSLGFKARRLRISLLLTQQKLAGMAGVSREEVDLFEHNLPLPLNSKRKILKVLWAHKASRR